MEKYLPSVAWLLAGIATVVGMTYWFALTVDIDDERSLWRLYVLYAALPVVALRSLFMAFAKLRGVIDVDDSQAPEPTNAEPKRASRSPPQAP